MFQTTNHITWGWLTSLYIDIIECVRHVCVGRQCVLVWLSNVSVLPRCLLNTSLKNKLWWNMFSFKFWVEWPFTAYHQYYAPWHMSEPTAFGWTGSGQFGLGRTDSGGFLFYHLLFLKWVWLNMLGKKTNWWLIVMFHPSIIFGHGWPWYLFG